jgi:3-dehydroquinate dehydratase-1
VSHSDWFDVIDSALAAKAQGADIIEIRLDNLKGSISSSTLDTLKDLKKDVDVPLLITLRPEREGGGYKGDEDSRVGILSDIIKMGFEYVDLELRMDGLQRNELIRQARESGVKTIISWHDFDKTPSVDRMVSRIAECENANGDITKIAVYNHSIEDAYNTLLAASSAGKNNTPYSIMGMGPSGYITRVLGPHVGCEIVYSALDSQRRIQEGQIPISILKELWKFLGTK